ncbi:MAG: lipopolysaccharide transport periplasmic protein LptA [Proteobacteria bacterium]|nr:lipopolysaccharide transport periplasmic protein LptA [Pseudomonadota bacterium]
MAKNKNSLPSAPFFCLLILFLAFNSWAQEEEATALISPVKITSDQMEADKNKGTVVFKGNVVVRQEEGIIMSELLTVYYNEKSEMEKIIAEGDVRINQNDRVGTCQLATYRLEGKSIVMEGDPRIWRGGDVVEGETITIFMDSDRMIVEGGARAVIHKKEDSKNAPEPLADSEGQ